MINNVLKLARGRWKPLQMSVRHSPCPVSFKHYLQNRPGTQYSILSNGLIVATEERDSYCVSFGFYIDGGSRYESETENGICHLFQHIAFKGTRVRNEQQVAQEMASLGAKLKSHTGRELIRYTVDCLGHDTPRALDLLTDCVFNNSCCKAVVEAQKQVVYMAMLDHDNKTNAVLMDYLHASAFQGTSLGHSVMGPTVNLCNFDCQQVASYCDRMLNPTRTVLAAVGGLKHEHTVELASKYLSKLEPRRSNEAIAYRYTGSDVRFRNDSLPAANVAIAVEGPCLGSDDNLVMEVARHLLGAWDCSQPSGMGAAPYVARCASIEKLCHAYKTFNINYKDCGLWGVHFVGDALQLDDMVLALQEEFMYLCVAVSDEEVARARRLFKAQLLSQVQSLPGARDDIGLHTLYQGFRPTLLEKLEAIDNITTRDVRAVCNKYLYDRDPVVAAIGPLEVLNDYNRIRAGMYWMRY